MKKHEKIKMVLTLIDDLYFTKEEIKTLIKKVEEVEYEMKMREPIENDGIMEMLNGLTINK